MTPLAWVFATTALVLAFTTAWFAVAAYLLTRDLGTAHDAIVELKEALTRAQVANARLEHQQRRRGAVT